MTTADATRIANSLDRILRSGYKQFCLKCGTYDEPVNADESGNPENAHLECAHCGAGEEYFTDDIDDVISYYKDGGK